MTTASHFVWVPRNFGWTSFCKEKNGAADLTRLGSAPHYWQLTKVNSFGRVRRVPLAKCSIWVCGSALVGQSSFHWPRYIVGAVDLFDYYVAVQVATLFTSRADHTEMHWGLFCFVFFMWLGALHVLFPFIQFRAFMLCFISFWIF